LTKTTIKRFCFCSIWKLEKFNLHSILKFVGLGIWKNVFCFDNIDSLFATMLSLVNDKFSPLVSFLLAKQSVLPPSSSSSERKKKRAEVIVYLFNVFLWLTPSHKTIFFLNGFDKCVKPRSHSSNQPNNIEKTKKFIDFSLQSRSTLCKKCYRMCFFPHHHFQTKCTLCLNLGCLKKQ